MKRNSNENLLSSTHISRRALILGAAQLGVIGALGARMRFLQVNEAEKYRLLAEENRINVRLLPPARGVVVDRKDRPVAVNTPNYRIIMVREDAGDVDAVLADLQKLIYVDPSDLTKARKELGRRSAFVPVTVTENLSWVDFAKVAANTPALPGILTEVGLSRIYPQNENLAHVVGYVGPVSDYYLEQTQDEDPLLQIPRFQVGKTGVEAQMETQLRGKAGNQKIEVNAVGRVMRELDRVEGRPGAALKLSVDSKLQNYILARMDGVSASAVVIDCTSGDLMAVGSTPVFDPNLFVRGISVKNYNGLRDDKFGPLRAKAVQGTYAPGSTFKMVVALAALEAGVIKPEDEVYCNGSLEVADRPFHCWKGSGHGKMSFEQSLMQSCDIYYYTLGLEVGIEAISSMAKRLGLGVRPDIPLSAVSRGVAPTKQWKRESFDKDWLIGDTVNASIGQGYVLASPLQLAVMTARLATGRIVTPRLIQSIDGTSEASGLGEKLDIDPQHLAIVQKAMFAVVNRRDGTAFKRRIVDEVSQMAGKTGTAQVRNISAEERRTGVIPNDQLPWEKRDHALFVNYAPANDPKVAVSVIVEHGGSGGAIAAPIARDITLFALNGGMPDLAAYPAKDRGVIAREQRDIAPKLDHWNSLQTGGSDQV